MNCQQADELIFSYCDGNLSSSLSFELESHADTCPTCLSKIDLTRLENDILRTDIVVSVLSDDFTSKVMASLPAKALSGPIKATATRSRRPWYTRTPLWLAATAAAFVLLLYTVSPGIFSPTSKVADQKSIPVKIAEKQHAVSNAVDPNVSAKRSVQNLKENADTAIDEQVNNYTLPSDTGDGAPLRTMLGGGPAGGGNELLKQRASCPDRDRSDATMLKAPVDYSGTAGAAPVISNMPSTYHMVSSNANDNGWDYVYEGDGKEITVSISEGIAGSDPPPLRKNIEIGSSENLPAAAAVGGVESGTLNSVNRSIEIDNVNYELTVSGELPLDQLNTVSSLLTVQQ